MGKGASCIVNPKADDIDTDIDTDIAIRARLLPDYNVPHPAIKHRDFLPSVMSDFELIFAYFRIFGNDQYIIPAEIIKLCSKYCDLSRYPPLTLQNRNRVYMICVCVCRERREVGCLVCIVCCCWHGYM